METASATSIALVVEFHPENDEDLAALRRLARENAARVIAVAQVADTETMRQISESFETMPNVEFYTIGARIGRGSAIRLGLNKVRESYVAILSLEDRIENGVIASFFETLIASQVDGIFGYRVHQIQGGRTIKRHWRSRAFNLLVSLLFKTKVRDVQSPLKAFRTDALRAVLDNLQLYDHGFDADLTFNVSRGGLRILEMPLRAHRTSRRWPLVSTSIRTAASLFVLRLLNSRLGRNNIVSLLGRPVVLPIKRRYSILIFCWRDPSSPKAGGGEVYLHEQARCWVRQGHTVTWIAQRYAGSRGADELDGIRIVRRGRLLLVFPAAALWYVFRSGWKFDFIIDTMNGIPFFTPLFSRKPKICLIYHIHSKHFREELPPLLANIAVTVETKFVPMVYRHTPFITISNSSAREIEELAMTRLPLQVIHSGVSTELVPGRRSTIPTVVYIGRLRRYKGVRKLIDAFAEIKKTIVDARLIIAGTGDDEADLRRYASPIRDIVFTGRVSDLEKLRLLQEAWVFGMPSTLEGWGIVVIEAACCATPSVAYDVNGLRDCIVDGQTGLLAHSDTEFRLHLERVLSDETLREKMSAQSLQWAANFSWDRTAERTLDRIRRAQPWSTVFESEREIITDLAILEQQLTSNQLVHE